MSVFEHNRSRIYNPAQHPLVHDISSFGYVNPRLPGISLLGDAVNYIVAVLYPDYIGTFATPAALPVSATANQYAIVSDDGAGHAAGYVWSVIDNAGGWIKRYDMAWSMDAVLSETVNRTQYMYVQKDGNDDKDASGSIISGLYAGQRVYGGVTSGNNLTLSANSGDPNSSTHTGFVQVDDEFRPTIDNTFHSGSATFRWAGVYTVQAQIGTMALSGGSITDTSGAIGFGSANLSTSGTLAAGVATLASGSHIGTLTLSNGSITDSGGAIAFGSNTLSTTGAISGASGSQFGNLTLTNGQIVSGSGALSFGAGNLTTTGTLSSGALTASSGTIGTLGLNGDTLSTTNLNGDLVLSPNGTGKTRVTSNLQVDGSSTYPTGNITLTAGSLTAGNLTLATGGITSTGALSLSGTSLTVGNTLLPSADATKDLGSATARFHNLYLSNAITDGTNSYLISDLLLLRNNPYRDAARTQAAQSGDGLFWNGSQWLAASPDNEVVHNLIGGLTTGDAGHTQFVMLSGRAGGQVVQGGTAASENLTLESTSNVVKGSVLVKDNLKPNSAPTYSAGWSGTDLGDATLAFRNVYTRGQFYNFRFENVTSVALPSSSAQNTGRAVWATDNNKLYIDNGSAFQVAGVGKYLADLTFNGTQTSMAVTTTGIQDARNAIWQLCDNANSFERIYCSIQATSATQVTINANPALPAGSYRLIGLE